MFSSLVQSCCTSHNCLGQVWFSNERGCTRILGGFKFYHASSSQNLWGERDWQSRFYYILVPLSDLRRVHDTSTLNIRRGSFKETGFSPNTSKQTRILIHIFLKPQVEDNSLAFSIIYIGLHNRLTVGNHCNKQPIKFAAGFSK